MTVRTFLAHLRRDSRGAGPRLVFFVLCLAMGVGAVVSVSSFSRGLDQGIRREARSMLAADLAISGRRPIPDAALAGLDDALSEIVGSRRTRILETLTMAAGPAGTSRLVELKAVDGVYPFYGRLDTTPQAPLPELLADSGVVVGPELLQSLDAEVGDTLRLGGAEFQIRGIVTYEPDRIAGAFSMGPRVFLDGAGFERAGLEQYGSRIVYRTLVQVPDLPAEELETLSRALEAGLPDDGRYRVELWNEAQPQLREGLARTESYLGLAALLSLLVGGIGVAQTVQAWLAGRLDAIAILKCLGYRPREVFRLYLGQTVVLGLVASLVGIVLGVLLQAIPATLLRDILPTDQVQYVQPLAWARGLLVGVGIAVLFSLSPLSAARRVPPIRVLRRSAEPLPASRPVRLVTAAVVLGGVFLLAWSQSGSALRGAAFTGGLVAAGLLLAGAAIALVKLVGAPRHKGRLWVRHGLSALARPGAGTVGAIVALGLGVLVVLSMYLVERGLSSQLDRDLPDEAPTAFLVDIQPDQWPGVKAILEAPDAGAVPKVDSVPVVMARLAKLDGRSTDEIYQERKALRDERKARGDDDADDGELWSLRREQRLTYLDELPDDNEIIEGTLWSEPGVDEVTVEEEFARNLGIGVGSTITFDIQGVEVETKVTSLRKVDWSTFGINFFLVVEPGVLDDAPQLRIAAATLSQARVQEVQNQLAKDFPNVTVIQIREVLERVSAILAKLGLGVRTLGLLTVLAGLAILAGAVSAGAVKRGKEVALFKTLGMTRRQVVATFAVEYALVGAVAGFLGTVGGTVLAVAVLRQGMEIEWTPGLLPLATTLLGTVVLSVGAGLIASVPALQRRPIEVLRADVG